MRERWRERESEAESLWDMGERDTVPEYSPGSHSEPGPVGPGHSCLTQDKAISTPPSRHPITPSPLPLPSPSTCIAGAPQWLRSHEGAAATVPIEEEWEGRGGGENRSFGGGGAV